jgi:hypothetical protein
MEQSYLVINGLKKMVALFLTETSSLQMELAIYMDQPHPQAITGQPGQTHVKFLT